MGILLWAYDRQESGFTWGDLETAFNLTPKQKEWVQKVFRSNMPAAENLIDHMSYDGRADSHLFVITAKGTTAAIQYLNLNEAQNSGKRAECIAIIAIIIGIVVGLAQIAITIKYSAHTNPSSTASPSAPN